MGVALKITRLDHTPQDLRSLASKTQDAPQSRRMLAIAMALEGMSRAEAAQRCGMDRQTLRDWIIRYNAQGAGGLKSLAPPGRKPLLDQAAMNQLQEWVLAGPDPERHQVVRWRCVDLLHEVEATFAVKATERTMGLWLRKLNMTRLQPRPYHPKRDAAAREAFKKTSPPV